ncbi:myosin-binding protein 2-like [Pyrus communis]|uniref:myosin-binding protein 2-like n=1 Tax=Pyrus communis TaxID=23211 RepID=UPI0035C1AC2F
MAANKFATMLHRNTNKITLVLIYALLEWILIILLLLNSLFSYLILKFSDYFGLKRPCLWCSRLDHIFHPRNTNNSYRDLVCESHANEISQLGYCSNHQKLAELQDMCEDCSSKPDCEEWSKKFAFFPWMKQIGMIRDGDEKVNENGDEKLNCSCCGLSLNKFYPSCIVIKPSWEVLDYAQKQNLSLETGDDHHTEEGDRSDRSGSDFEIGNKEGVEEKKGENRGFEAEDHSAACSVCDYGCKEEIAANGDEEVERVIEEEQGPTKDIVSPKIRPQDLEFYIDQDDSGLVLVDLIDSPTTIGNQSNQKYNKVEEDQGNSSGWEDVILDFDIGFERQEAKPVVESWRGPEKSEALLSFDESKEEESWVSGLDSKGSDETEGAKEENEQVGAIANGEIVSDVHQEFEDDVLSGDDEIDAEVSIGTEIPDQELTDEVQSAQGLLHSDLSHNDEIDAEVSIGTEIPDQEENDEVQSAQELLYSYACEQEDPSTSSANLHDCDHHGSEQAEEELLEFKTLSVETSEKEKDDHFSLEVDHVLDTPTSIDSLHQFHKGMLLFERRELVTEDSLDGSVMSDTEGGDGVVTVEKLKTALRVERKALNELYAELEEERSASAVAASQTMAMINRLQEEKAAMQMEALQYQRMMEEQSEYDQEAMQLLNELMVKREKEKQELEKELEICRKKLQDYEVKEKMMILRRMKDGSTKSRTSSGACSNGEDSDGLSNVLNNESKGEDCLYGHEESSNQNTPVDAVLYLEESLASFEEEKLSILDQLNELEEKLLTLNDEEEEVYDGDIKPSEHLFLENGNGYHESSDVSSEINGNGIANDHSKEMNGNHQHQDRKIVKGFKAKRLLPLFDAIETKTEDGELNGNTEGYDSFTSQDSESKKLAIEEEVDHVYERLQALEADREFLKHCISSLRKGDKGLLLLQEILEHLRDLRSVELRLRTTGDSDL